MTHAKLAQLLSLPKSSVTRYAKAGCPVDSPENARLWINANRPRSVVTTKEYPVGSPVEVSTSARFERLSQTEAHLSQEINANKEQVLPSIVSRLCDATTAAERDALQREAKDATAQLIALRKQHLAVTKLIADIEAKRESATKGMISFNYALDLLTTSLQPVFQFLRSIDLEEDQQTLSKHIKNVFDSAIDKFIANSDKQPLGYENENLR
jgi:hypothetical protein